MAITPNTTFTAGTILTAAQMNRLPWGVVAQGTALTTTQTGITTAMTDVTGQSITWTADSSRIYMITARAHHYASGGASGGVLEIATGANVAIANSSGATAGGWYTNQTVVALVSGISGSVTYKMRAAAIGAGTTMAIVGNATAATYSTLIYAMDIGQA